MMETTLSEETRRALAAVPHEARCELANALASAANALDRAGDARSAEVLGVLVDFLRQARAQP